MNVVMGSMWRDMGHVTRARFEQWYALGTALQKRGDYPVCVFVEGGSTDNTWSELNEFGGCGHVHTVCIQRDDGCPFFPSVDQPARWRHLAWLGNHTLEEVTDDCDIFFYVESDLMWDPADMLRLIDQAAETQQAISAMNIHVSGRYYDTWGTRAQGRRFQQERPFHPVLEGWESGLVPVDSACGAIAMPGQLAMKVRFQPEDCYVGLCRDIRSKGVGVWLDPTIEVIHP